LQNLLTRLDHPHVVRILGAGKLPRPFIVLEKLKDVSMLLDLHADGALPFPTPFPFPFPIPTPCRYYPPSC